ncbi:putative Integrase zinc binding domain-containing protein 1 [Homarus americanus]|uniref:RNA-directed DNA polymerase n=1 Tax=Homarus americanus TaxID=6706 RepID=A0A8J5JI79_HOMAM|nr:putative Integrase zinc binding domain-containing protein 1 [Homarus americanus]
MASCCRREAVPKKCSLITVEEDPAITEEGLEKLQLEGQDLRPMVEWMSQSSVRPAWETISGASPLTKNYWAQWDALRLKDGLLQCKWVTTNALNRYWQTVLPRKMRSEIPREMHNNLTSVHLGVKKTLSRLRQRFYWVVIRRPPDEELPEETTSYIKNLQERLMEVHHQVRGALEFSGEVMKRTLDVKASHVCYMDGDKVWLYNPLRKKGQSLKLQSPWEEPYTVVERLSDVTYRIRGRRKAQPQVVHVNRLWQYHGSGQYTWEDSEEQPPITNEDQTGDPGRTLDRTDLGNPTMDQEEEHCSLLAELDVTGEGDRSEDVSEAAAPREDSADIPVRRRQQQKKRRPTKFQDYYNRDGSDVDDWV